MQSIQPLPSQHTGTIHHFVSISLSLVFLWIAYGGVGWLLSAYRSPPIVTVGTLIITIYLAWAGWEAIVLTSMWVVLVLSISAINHAWMWQIPRPIYQVEPFTLLVIWLLLLGLVVLTANVHHQLRQQYDRVQILYRLILPLWAGLICGLFLYDYVTLPLLSR